MFPYLYLQKGGDVTSRKTRFIISAVKFTNLVDRKEGMRLPETSVLSFMHTRS